MPVIKLKNNEISYDFSFEQKYLFIRGDSGIGKTSLIQLVSNYNTNPDAIICDGDTNINKKETYTITVKPDMICWILRLLHLKSTKLNCYNMYQILCL